MRFRLVALLIILIMQVSSNCIANDLYPKGNYRINIGDRPDAPYPGLNNYNAALTQSGNGPQYTVPVTRHHIIPFALLRDFHNRLIGQRNSFLARGFFNEFGPRIYLYAGNGGMNCQDSAREIALSQAISSSLAAGTMMGGGLAVPDGWDDFQQFYAWMPWNLFIGPTNRRDDPHTATLDASAQWIIQNDSLWQQIVTLNDLMTAYVGGDDSVLGRIVSLLRTMSRTTEMYPLVADQWVNNGGGYYSVRRSGDQGALTVSGNGSRDIGKDSCYNVFPNRSPELIAYGVV